jgi:hypothetical protein
MQIPNRASLDALPKRHSALTMTPISVNVVSTLLVMAC